MTLTEIETWRQDFSNLPLLALYNHHLRAASRQFIIISGSANFLQLSIRSPDLKYTFFAAQLMRPLREEVTLCKHDRAAAQYPRWSLLRWGEHFKIPLVECGGNSKSKSGNDLTECYSQCRRGMEWNGWWLWRRGATLLLLQVVENGCENRWGRRRVGSVIEH